MESQRYDVIAATIDKFTHYQKYQSAAFHPYHYCLTIMLERYCGYLDFFKANGDVLAESRGARENNELNAAYQEVYSRGTFYRAPGFFQNVLTSKHIKIKKKEDNIAGLQFADLIAHASKVDTLNQHKVDTGEEHQFESEIIKRLQSKYNSNVFNGRIAGYGRIFLK